MPEARTCVILCPGPSLREAWPPKGFRPEAFTVLAINEAGAWYAHDWFVAWDTDNAVDWFNPRPRVGVAGRRGQEQAELGAFSWFELPDKPFLAQNFTLPRAACLVKHLGFDEATLLGADWAGKGSVTGADYVSIRDESRWRAEAYAVGVYCEHYGVGFKRVAKVDTLTV